MQQRRPGNPGDHFGSDFERFFAAKAKAAPAQVFRDAVRNTEGAIGALVLEPDIDPVFVARSAPPVACADGC